MSDRYVELLYLEMDTANIHQAKAYDFKEEEKVVRQRRAAFIPTLTNAEKEAWKGTTGLFNVKLKHFFRKIIHESQF